MEQQKLEKAKQWYQKVCSSEQMSDQEAEKYMNTLLFDAQFESEEIVANLIIYLKKDLHEEKKMLENYRDRAEKINLQLQQL